ncbi:hypothetical protein, partial [Microcoleus sp. CAWBG27]|uniref:hypothetical protein n=1 Tax=Microcoleus sp. CAWBG27 TaxID=2841645 RepID=UPI0025DC47F2
VENLRSSMVEKKCQSNAKTSLCLPERSLGYLRLFQNRDAPLTFPQKVEFKMKLIKQIESNSQKASPSLWQLSSLFPISVVLIVALKEY